MNKLGLLFIFILVFSLSSPALEESPLKIKASVEPQRLSRAEEGKIVLDLTSNKGVTISPQPSFTIEFDPCDELIFPKNFFNASDLGIEILEDNGYEYLNLKDPIEIYFTVSPEAKRGRHNLQGKIKYFARSQEGWCLKTFSKFSVSFSTRSTRVKKK
ncbi:MAG: hypothetical protein ACETWK_09100 [Candidatus Aminicenantaceae bacterium]